MHKVQYLTGKLKKNVSDNQPFDDHFFCIRNFYYLNNTYVIWISGSSNFDIFVYGSDISSEFNLNTNFCNIKSDEGLLAYGNNEWVLCAKCNEKSCLYFSNGIVSLSPVSKQTIFHKDDKSD